jgi:hypothetical protein
MPLPSTAVKRKERFAIVDQVKTKARRVPAKQLDAAIDEAVRTSRARR